MYKNNQRKLKAKLNQIFIAPDKVFSTFHNQSVFLRNLHSNGFPFPPSTRFIIIDNISHHLRYKVSQINEVNARVMILDDFYSSGLLPLILHCSRENIILFFIHEVSFNPTLQRTRPFFNSLYERMKGLNITLKQFKPTKKRIMVLKTKGHRNSIEFKIKDSGFEFSDSFI